MEKRLRKLLKGGSFSNVPAARSFQMSRIQGCKNKSTECRLRGALARAGICGWVMHPREISGSPDFYFRALHIAVFVDGCFWHGCPRCGHLPKTNPRFWRAKIQSNRERDRTTSQRLVRLRVTVLRFWEHELAQHLSDCVERVRVESGRLSKTYDATALDSRSGRG
jgi:DNA mismatch endonuclease (patch repair protein)